MSLEIQITTLTPICLASGLSFGAGQEDTQIDLEGNLPIFRGRTLKGLLSEEVAAILAVLDTEDGTWHEAAAQLFGKSGSATSAAVSYGNGVLGEGYRTAAGKWKELVTEALTVARHQTKIDRNTGIPQKGSLRGTRLARAGLVFHFPLNEHQPLSDRALVLLAAGVASLKRAGLHRNRGWGEIKARLWLDGVDRTMALVKGLKGGNLAIHRTKSTKIATRASRAKVLRVDLALTSPAVLAKTGSEPSTVETHDFIPGTSLLGALAALWLASNKTDDAAANPTFRKLFLDGTTRYLNAYPLHKNQRYLPVPKTWLVEKYKDTPVKDMACSEATANNDDKLLGSGFVWLDREDDDVRISHYNTELKTSLHHQRDRELGRSTEKMGELYSYQAIVSGQTFRSYILCDDENLSEVVVELLNRGPLSLGRSRSATYGGNATVNVIPEKPDWSEYTKPEDLDDCENLTVTLLSDYLGSKDGLANPETLVDELRAHLGLPADVKATKFVAAGLAGGYVSAWKMPRPASTTLAAGSVLVFNVPFEDIDQDSLRVLEHNGLGSRRSEGFGRLAVGWHGDKAVLSLTKASPEQRKSSLVETQEFLKVKNDVIHHVLEKQLRLAAFDQARLATRVPNPSLLGRVRMRVRTAKSAAEFIKFLNAIKSRKDHQGLDSWRLKEAGKSLDRCKVDKKTLLSWLEGWANGSNAWHVDVTNALERLGLPKDACRSDWKFVKIFLDAFLESLRRRGKRETSA